MRLGDLCLLLDSRLVIECCYFTCLNTQKTKILIEAFPKMHASAGVLQEKMAVKKYGLLGARFPHLNALVGVQSMACFLWAGLLLLVFPVKGKTMAPITSYWLPGLTNTAGPALGFQALKNISYPAQVAQASAHILSLLGPNKSRVIHAFQDLFPYVLYKVGHSLFWLHLKIQISF